MRRIMTIACTVGNCLALSGCYESTSVTLYEPGEYKGKQDPLLEKLEDSELRQDLDQRFAGQRDR